jgi:hypothetical protein
MVGVTVRTVLGFLRHVAHVAAAVDGRSGAIVIGQRFGGAMNLNVHAHALVIDGVFTGDGADVRFWIASRSLLDTASANTCCAR